MLPAFDETAEVVFFDHIVVTFDATSDGAPINNPINPWVSFTGVKFTLFKGVISPHLELDPGPTLDTQKKNRSMELPFAKRKLHRLIIVHFHLLC